MATVPSFDYSVLESICHVLGATDTGLSNSEIDRLLKQLEIAHVPDGANKRSRLLAALSARQTRDGCGNQVIAFIQQAMTPVRYIGSPALFEERRNHLNTALAFAGYEFGADGQMRHRTVAVTLAQAEQRALNLRHELVRRGAHADVLKFCTAELVNDDYFHAVLEAMKSVSQKIREKTGLTGDGGELANKALSLGQVGVPFLAFNRLQSDSEKSEQSGLMNLMIGMFSTFRNPAAHAPRIYWHMSEQDALDSLMMASFLHRRLDSAARTQRQS